MARFLPPLPQDLQVGLGSTPPARPARAQRRRARVSAGSPRADRNPGLAHRALDDAHHHRLLLCRAAVGVPGQARHRRRGTGQDRGRLADQGGADRRNCGGAQDPGARRAGGEERSVAGRTRCHRHRRRIRPGRRRAGQRTARCAASGHAGDRHRNRPTAAVGGGTGSPRRAGRQRAATGQQPIRRLPGPPAQSASQHRPTPGRVADHSGRDPTAGRIRTHLQSARRGLRPPGRRQVRRPPRLSAARTGTHRRRKPARHPAQPPAGDPLGDQCGAGGVARACYRHPPAGTGCLAPGKRASRPADPGRCQDRPARQADGAARTG